MLHRKSNQVKCVATTDSNIASVTSAVSPRPFLDNLNWVRSVSISTADNHRLTIICAQSLQSSHKPFIHAQLSSVLAAKFIGAEVRVVLPVHSISAFRVC